MSLHSLYRKTTAMPPNCEDVTYVLNLYILLTYLLRSYRGLHCCKHDICDKIIVNCYKQVILNFTAPTPNPRLFGVSLFCLLTFRRLTHFSVLPLRHESASLVSQVSMRYCQSIQPLAGLFLSTCFICNCNSLVVQFALPIDIVIFSSSSMDGSHGLPWSSLTVCEPSSNNFDAAVNAVTKSGENGIKQRFQQNQTLDLLTNCD